MISPKHLWGIVAIYRLGLKLGIGGHDVQVETSFSFYWREDARTPTRMFLIHYSTFSHKEAIVAPALLGRYHIDADLFLHH